MGPKKQSVPSMNAAVKSRAELLKKFVDSLVDKVDTMNDRAVWPTISMIEARIKELTEQHETALQLANLGKDDADPFPEDVSNLVIDVSCDAMAFQLQLESIIKNDNSELPMSNDKKRTQRHKMDYVPFRQEYPDLWFVELERQFTSCEILTESDRFTFLLRFLNEPQHISISSITKSSKHLVRPYSDTKKVLLDEYASTFIDHFNRAIVEESPRSDESMKVF